MDRLTNHQEILHECIGCTEESNCYEFSCGKIEEAIQKLAYYEDMEEQEKLVILPCNVSDRIHTFYKSDIEWCFEVGMNIEEILEDICEERRVTGFDVRDDGLWIILNGGIFNPDNRIPAEEFGKTVFLTKQEEIEALERMKGE